MEYLTKQAIENPAQFMTLLGKVLPMQVTGTDGEPIKHAIKVTIVDSKCHNPSKILQDFGQSCPLRPHRGMPDAVRGEN